MHADHKVDIMVRRSYVCIMNTAGNSRVEIIKRDFLPIVKEVFAESVRSVMLYGSAATNHYVKNVSDINVLIIVDRVVPPTLKKFGRRARRIFKKHRITPLVMSTSEFSNSADVFPMEYFDMRRRHIVLLGEDFTAGLDLSRRNLRHQVEDGLRGGVTVLRQVVIAAYERERFLTDFLKQWFGSQAAVLRGLLRLKIDSEIPEDLGEIVGVISEQFGVDVSSLKKLFELREARRRESRKLDGFKIAADLDHALSELIELVDGMEL